MSDPTILERLRTILQETSEEERDWDHNYCLKLGLKIIQFMSRVVRCRESHAERQRRALLRSVAGSSRGLYEPGQLAV